MIRWIHTRPTFHLGKTEGAAPRNLTAGPRFRRARPAQRVSQEPDVARSLWIASDDVRQRAIRRQTVGPLVALRPHQARGRCRNPRLASRRVCPTPFRTERNTINRRQTTRQGCRRALDVVSRVHNARVDVTRPDVGVAAIENSDGDGISVRRQIHPAEIAGISDHLHRSPVRSNSVSRRSSSEAPPAKTSNPVAETENA